MADRDLKSISFSDIPNVKYVIPAFDGEGTYDDLTVGTAKNVIGEIKVTDQEPYLFRKTGGSTDVGNREYDTLVGASAVWNQLVNENDTEGWRTQNGVTINSVSDEIIDCSFSQNGGQVYHNIRLTEGHKFLSFVDIKAPSSTAIFVVYGGSSTNYKRTAATTDWQTITSVWSGSVYPYVLVRLESGNTADNTIIRHFQVIDLTAFFGSSTIADYVYSLEQSTAGSGIAWLKKYFPTLFEYHEYDAGTLKSVENVESHDMVGFNQWDEEWENGSIGNNGSGYSNPSAIRSKNFCPILPNTTYYFRFDSASGVVGGIYFYDVNKAFISNSGISNTTFTTPENARFFKIAMNNAYGNTYNHDICINLSWDGERNGEYEPYVKHSYPLDDSLTLRGIPKLDANNQLYYDGDTYEADGTVTRRYGIVDLGTLEWAYDSTNEQFQTSVLSPALIPKGFDSAPAYLCTKYASMPYGYNATYNDTDKVIFAHTSGSLRVRDSAYTDATVFKSAMSGIMLVYELATPTTESAEPYTNPQIVDDWGTEEYVTDCLIPVGHETKYPEDVVEKVGGLPSDFSTLIAPVEKKMVATRNYAIGNYLIVDNQLYKVTSAITSGNTITVGTNVSATTIMAELLAIQ